MFTALGNKHLSLGHSYSVNSEYISDEKENEDHGNRSGEPTYGKEYTFIKFNHEEIFVIRKKAVW